MSKVVDIITARPHLAGKCICLQCKYEWEGVAPLGTLYLQCPECWLDKGIFNCVTFPERYWECKCGCAHFAVGVSHIVCLFCGISKEFCFND